MRVRLERRLADFDAVSLLRLVQPLRDEWAAMSFGSDGLVVNPLTAEPDPGIRLISGRHRSPGAVYRFEEQAPAEGSGPEPFEPTLLRDDTRGLAFSVREDYAQVTAEVTWDRAPSVRIEATMDVRTALSQSKAPGLLARRFGKEGTGELHLRSAALTEPEGTLVSGTGALSPFRGELEIRSTRGSEGWTLATDVRIRGRGLGRIALLLGGGFVTRSLTEFSDEHPEDDALGALGAELAQMASDAEAMGHAAYVRRELWGPSRSG